MTAPTKRGGEPKPMPERRISACRCCGRVGLVNGTTGTCIAPTKAGPGSFKRVHYCQRVAARRLERQRATAKGRRREVRS